MHHRSHPHWHRHPGNAGKQHGKGRYRHPDQPLRKPALRHRKGSFSHHHLQRRKGGPHHSAYRRRDRRSHYERPLRYLRGGKAHQPVCAHLLLHDSGRYHEIHPRHPGGRRYPRDGKGASPVFPHSGCRRQVLRYDQPPQHHQPAQAPHHSGGPQRGHTGGGGLRSGRDSGDHRPPPHR